MRRFLVLLALIAAPLAAQDLPQAVPAPGAPLPSVSPVMPGETMAPGAAVPAALPAAETDLVQIVLHAHWVVQAVMAALAGMAFLVLTVLVFKTAEIALAARRLRQTLRLAAADPGAPLPARPEPGAAMLRLIRAELAGLPGQIGAVEAEGLRERCRIGLTRIQARALHGLRSGVGLLAQIAATAPFIGLFGTVFGIMNAFLAIAATKTTSLSVVAPGIAEALLATAVGLGAAIPAVLVYNFLTRRIAVYRHGLGDVEALVESHLSREIERRRLGGRDAL
ncbi:MotA/TolQ/ExbB proton channel family protein [Stagnihabitans tardus]|uniref:TonB-system energizer ExbB n=1 Tax=Stagnihabitans tardus TaxID=2699202 RepID=A0AAE5BTA7_9RHOB|nr:MotA/TolQ/ExbB proton channel family protein [Stagnihabitans tardus]NBZ86466.1 tonB-system energizer ExbB [Stagnihabitans tardus]